MGFGILDMIGLAATLVFAIPVANFGIDRLLAGNTAMGLALLGVAAAMVLLPQYFMDLKTILRKLVRGVLPRRLRGGSVEADVDGIDRDSVDGSDTIDATDAADTADPDDRTDR